LFATVLVPHLERQAHVAADADHYTELAASLIDRGEFGFAAPGFTPTSVRGPGFPVWLAIGMLLGGRSTGWVAFWACVPGLLAALTIAIVLGRSHGRIVGLAGGLLCAAHPLVCFVSARALPDEFYGAALFVGLVAWQRSLRSVRTPHLLGWATLAGLLLCAASLTRVTALGVLIVLAAIGLLTRPRRLRSCAVVVLVAASLLGPWTWRTSALVGRPTFVESLAGYNFWLGESADRYGFAPDFGVSRARAHELMAREAGTQETRSPSFWYATLSPREARTFDEKLVDAGLTRIGKLPLSYAGRCVSGLLWFWIRAETAPRTIQYALIALPLVALSLFGLSRMLARPEPGELPVGLVVAIVVFHVVIYAASCPMARYSVQVYPLMCYLAAAGFAHGGRKLVDGDSRI
jgi:4-amino-4-deoxy-L-arabinose transferase-like glycosyltransferase